MADHEIRLRAAWQSLELPRTAKSIAVPRNLPIDWSSVPLHSEVILLTRRFHKPPTDPDQESVWLRLIDAPGICSLKLNGECQEVWRDVVRLDGFLEFRNELELEVVLAAASGIQAWGKISLAIRKSAI